MSQNYQKPRIIFSFSEDGMISVMDRTIELGLKKNNHSWSRIMRSIWSQAWKIIIQDQYQDVFLLKENVINAVVKLLRRFEMKRDIFLGVFSSLYSIEGIPINLSVLLQNSRFLHDEKFFQLQKLKFLFPLFSLISMA